MPACDWMKNFSQSLKEFFFIVVVEDEEGEKVCQAALKHAAFLLALTLSPSLLNIKTSQFFVALGKYFVDFLMCEKLCLMYEQKSLRF